MNEPPAIVIGLELNGLGVVRSLAAGGVPMVVGLDTDPHRPGARTRHARLQPIRAFDGPELVQDLLELGTKLPCRPVLFATKEGTVATLSDARDRLAPLFRFLLPPAATLRALTDKAGFQAAAERGGAPVPRAVLLAGEGDLARAQALRFPCVLKPDRHVPQYEKRFRKAYKVEGFEALEGLYALIHPVHPRMIVQEWIEGADAEIYFCLQYRDATGRALGSFTGRKIRTWPSETGGTASCTAASDLEPTLLPPTEAFFAQTGCVGMVGMEWKRDRPSGRFLMVEPTVGRTDHQAEVATLNGVNLPLIAYRDLTGGQPPIPPVRPMRARIWRDPVADGMAARVPGAAPTPPGVLVDGYARLHDPFPWLALQWRRVRRRARLQRPAAPKKAGR